ncbi:MAG: hypothetical protein ACRBFS_11040 [Aureispira sp.]
MYKGLKLIIGTVCLLMGTTLQAQLDDSQTEFLKPFRAKLAQSQKFEAQPLLPRLDTNSNKKLNYVVPTHLLGLPYPAPIIRPLAMPRGRATEVYNFYAKAGFGYPLSPLIELSYFNDDIERLKYGAQVRHHSVLQGYLPNQNFTQTGIDVQVDYFLEKGLVIGGTLDFDFNTNRFYGFDPVIESYAITEDSMRQRFLNIGGNVHLFNGTLNKSAFNYRVDLDVYRYSDAFKSTEVGIAPNVTLEKWFGKGKQRSAFRLKTGLSYLNFQDIPVEVNNVTTTATKQLTLIHFNPTFVAKLGAFKMRLGLNTGLNASASGNGNTNNFYIHPDVEFSYAIASGAFVPYIGAVGQVRQNSFRSLTTYNRFLVSNPALRHTNYLELFGGLKGSIKKINYDIRGGYALTQDLPYFVNDTGALTQFSRFRPVYDTASIIFVKGTVDFRLLDDLVIGGTAGFHAYNTTNFEKAFHLPTFESNIFVEYILSFKGKLREQKGKTISKGKIQKTAYNPYLSFRGEFYVNSGVPYLDENQEVGVLQGLYDLNLGVDLHVSDHVILFADFNNILHNRNQRWYQYRQLGFNAMVGAKVRF